MTESGTVILKIDYLIFNQVLEFPVYISIYVKVWSQQAHDYKIVGQACAKNGATFSKFCVYLHTICFFVSYKLTFRNLDDLQEEVDDVDDYTRSITHWAQSVHTVYTLFSLHNVHKISHDVQDMFTIS